MKSFALIRADPDLSELLHAETASTAYDPADKVSLHIKRGKQVNFLGVVLAGNRNVHVMCEHVCTWN